MNAVGCLKIQVETEAVSGATCKIAAIGQKFVDTANVYVAMLRIKDNPGVNRIVFCATSVSPCLCGCFPVFSLQRHRDRYRDIKTLSLCSYCDVPAPAD
jgi:hypothetical protein